METQKSPPPALPPRLLALAPVVYVGTAVWLLAFVLLALGHYVLDLVPPIWMWTALCGFVLGMIGVPVMWWQSSASRRGSRGAQKVQ
ncbi:hypothetical protein BU204_09495 [Actinophytocola xanthii]|uniref:DUF2530 domain-containing protein n=1 Tax=Actinophytocola xanthii TaxID=1912961 RepID=A0A1Q8CU07_9PSEU|nr:hypothetical protein BU204_09495 [Actinophytocola xanthii]